MQTRATHRRKLAKKRHHPSRDKTPYNTTILHNFMTYTQNLPLRKKDRLCVGNNKTSNIAVLVTTSYKRSSRTTPYSESDRAGQVTYLAEAEANHLLGKVCMLGCVERTGRYGGKALGASTRAHTHIHTHAHTHTHRNTTQRCYSQAV